jgi:hypothetical protein
VDTVLLLGFFYHTHRHFELASLVSATGASHIVLDTAIASGPPPPHPPKAFIEYRLESTGFEGNTMSSRAKELVGRPSRRIVELMFGQVGFELANTDCSVKVEDPTRMEDYRDGKREIFVFRKAAATSDARRDAKSLPAREMSR